MIAQWNGDGRSFAGRSATAVVDAMRLGGIFTSGKSIAEYMSGVSGRITRLGGERIDTTSADAFLRGLAAAGFITILRSN